MFRGLEVAASLRVQGREDVAFRDPMTFPGPSLVLCHVQSASLSPLDAYNTLLFKKSILTRCIGGKNCRFQANFGFLALLSFFDSPLASIFCGPCQTTNCGDDLCIFQGKIDANALVSENRLLFLAVIFVELVLNSQHAKCFVVLDTPQDEVRKNMDRGVNVALEFARSSIASFFATITKFEFFLFCCFKFDPLTHFRIITNSLDRMVGELSSHVLTDGVKWERRFLAVVAVVFVVVLVL